MPPHPLAARLVGQTRRLAGRFPVTLGYLSVLLVAASLVEGLPDRDADDLLFAASTNLANLGRGHVETLLLSALVPGPTLAATLPLLVVVLVLGEAVLGSLRSLAVFATVHVGVSLLVAGLLALSLLPGVSSSAARQAVDVGPSYGLFALLGALLVTLGRRRYALRWRLVAAAAAAVTTLALGVDVADAPTFTAWGHLLSLVAGGLIGAAWRPWVRAGVPA